ncbi:MAG: hypothetical protein AAB618_03165 [Patescibacteria group bacterium]
MAYLYNFNPLTGLSAGILMSIGSPMPNNPSRIAPPHLRVDSAGFIGVNTRWQHARFVSGKLMRSSLTVIEPVNGRSFKVFDAPRPDDDFISLIFVDVSTPKNMTRRPDADVTAWMGIRGQGFQTLISDKTTGAALLQCEPDASIELFQFDGSVHLLSVVKGKVSTVPLTQKQMAHLRVEQFEEQISSFDLSLERDIRRLHGIIAGALRLVPVVKDKMALNVLVDFFTKYQLELTDNLRKQVRWALTDAGHEAAATFLDGFEAVNVVRLNSDGPAKRAVSEKKKRERAELDRQRTYATKNGGRGNGGGQQPLRGKKK